MKRKILMLSIALGVGLASCQTKEENKRDEFRERMKYVAEKHKDRKAKEEREEQKEIARNKASGIIRVEDIYAEFKANEVRCKEKYHHKRFKVKGAIEGIKDTHIDFKGDGALIGSVSAITGKEINGQNIVSFNTGDEIVVEGEIVFIERIRGVTEITILCTERAIKEWNEIEKRIDFLNTYGN
jgi:hypothetical protein